MNLATLNSAVKSSVESIIQTRKIPHAILIEGENTEKVLELAGHIAEVCVCEGENRPCGSCKQCLLSKAGSNPDIQAVSVEDGKKNISVAQIRELRAQAYVKAHAADNRVFIIEQAELMNEQAQNALLKVLEEPPQGVIFILITPQRTMLLPTVISRCTVLSLSVSGEEGDDLTKQKEFLKFFKSGSEFEMLRILQTLEKDRLGTEKFFLNLKVAIAQELRRSQSVHTASMLNELYNQADEYIGLLKTNINLPLLFSAAVARAKNLTEM